MARRKPDPPPAAEHVATTTAGALATTGIAVLANGNPAAAGLTALVAGTVGFIIKSALAWKGADVDRWWGAVRGADGEAFEQELEARAASPDVQDTVMRSVRAVLDAVDPAAIPPLARLSRWYLDESKKPDAFFRSAARFLAEVSADELEQLRAILTWVVPHCTAPRATLQLHDFRDRREMRATEHVEPNAYHDVGEHLPWPGESPSRLFHAMDLAGLTRVGRGANTTAEASTDIDRATALALKRILATP